MTIFAILGAICMFALCVWLVKDERDEARRIAALLTPEQLNDRLSWAEYFGDREILSDELAARQAKGTK